MAKDSLFSIASLAVNQMIVIDKNGDIKIATIGEKLPEGSVVIQRGDEAGFNNEATTQIVDQNNELQDVTDDVAQLLAALEEGQDPTQLDEELAPAAGGSNGSAPTDSASIDRVGSEIIASTNFSTTGFESLGFSQTQSLALINLTRSNVNANVEAADKNSDPKAQNDTISIDEDTSVTIDVLSNDSDKDGDTLTIVSATVPQEQGSVEIVGGKLVFTPAENYNGQANIEYTISDGQGGFDTATVTVTVNSVNDAPVAKDDEVTTEENTVLNSHVPEAQDVDGTTERYQLVNSVTSGTLTFNKDGSYKFDPGSDFDYLDEDETTEVTFTYTATDNEGAISEVKTITITVTGSNDAPEISVGTGDSVQATISEDGYSNVPHGVDPTVITGTLTAHDADDAVSSLKWSTSGEPTQIDSVGENYSNDLLAQLGSFKVNESTGEWTFDLNSAGAQYLDEGDVITLTYSVEVKDDNGETDKQNVVITVTGSNDAPEISVGTGDSVQATISEDGYSNVPHGVDPTVITGTLTAHDADDAVSSLKWSTSGEPTQIDSVGENYSNDLLAQLGSFKVNESTGEWTFDLNSAGAQYLDEGDVITLTYSVEVKDDNGETDKQNVVITVTGSNDAPEISVGTGDSVQATISEDGYSNVPHGVDPTVITGTLTAHDADDAVSSLIWSTSGHPLVALATTSGETYSDYDLAKLGSFELKEDINGNHYWVFDLNSGVAQYLNQGDVVTLTYSVKVSDDNKDYDVQEVTIRVEGSNDIPVVRLVSLDSLSEATISGDTENGYTITTEEDVAGVHGTVAATDADSGDVKTYSFDNLSDGYTVTEQTVNDVVIYTLTTPSGSTVTLNSSTGEYTYEPAEDYNGDDESFTVLVSDSYGATDSVVVSLNVTPENDPPVAEDDKGTVMEGQSSVVGNVLDNDTDVDTPHEDLKVTSVNYKGVDYLVDNSNGAQITTPSGVLSIYRDGSYTFEANTDSDNNDSDNNGSTGSIDNIMMYGVSSSNQSTIEEYIADLESQESNTNSNGSGTGVGEGNESKLSEGESLIVDLKGSVTAVALSLSEVKQSEITISVYDSEGKLLKNGEDYTYTLTSQGSKTTAAIESEEGDIGYVVLGVHDSKNGKDFYRVDGISSVTYADTDDDDSDHKTSFEEQFTYTVEDGDGGSDTATLIVNGDYLVDESPTITFESGQDNVVVSEEGLSALNANPDSEGIPDTTNDAIAQGTFSVSDVDTDSDDLSVSLTAPDVALYSNNVAIKWSTENGNLVGKAGNETILLISLSQDSSNPSSYSYTVTLLGSLDHADKTAEDTLSFDVGVEVSDGTNTVKDSITVTVEDDSPDVPVNIVINAVGHNETTTSSLGEFNFTQRPNDSGCHNNNAYTFIDTNSGNSVFVYAVGLLGTHHEELTFSNNSGMGVKSSSFFGPFNDRTDGEIDYQYGNSEKIVMELGDKVAYGMQVSLAEFYSNEGEKGKIIFLLDGKVVQEEDLIATHSNGNYSASFNVASGFDEVRFEAVTNGNGWCSDNSDYSIKSVSFESVIVDPVIATDEGTITADLGADGAGVITLTGVADTNIKTADGLPVTLGSTDVVDGVKTQVWVDSHGDKVFEIELNSSTGEWSYRQFAELAKGDSVEITYDVVDADGDIVSSTSPNTGTDNDFTSGLKGEFYNVGYQLGTIAQAVYVTEHQNANATFTSSEISYIGQDWDDLGDYDSTNESTNLESWLGDDAQSVEFKNKTDSNDAVVRLIGGVALDAGTYSIKVNADDGYRIIIDGRTVASFDSNTSVRSEEFTFSVDENGIHQIEVIYWDQGGAYVLEVSLNDGSGYELLGSEAYPTYSGYNVDITDYVNSVGTSNNDHLVGTAANDHIQGLGAQDHLFGGAGDDWLEGGEGDDHLIGGSGKDILDGGSGQDSLSGGSGDDKLYGQQGDDLLSGESGSDYLDGGQGQDYLYGGLGKDILVGGDGDDKLFGDEGDDVLIGGSGHDQLTGGSGSDVFVIEGSNSSDTIMDFNVQEDIVDISELLNIDSSSDHDAIQAYLDSESSSLSITANGDGSATISVADHSAGSFGADSHIVSGDIVSVLFNNQEYTLKVD